MRTVQVSKLLARAVLPAALGFWAAPASALTLEVDKAATSLVGDSFEFKATATDSVGAVQYRWTFGDETMTEFEVGKTSVSHVYDKPGHYTIAVTAKDESASFAGETWTHVVHYPVTAKRPNASTSIVYDAPRNRVYCVNQDNDTISSIDPMTLMKVGELPVYTNPEALALAPMALHLFWQVAALNPDDGADALAKFRSNRFAGFVMFLACLVVGTA